MIQEIFKLKDMLDKANIPYEWRSRYPFANPKFESGYQIGYPICPINATYDEPFVCSVVEGYGTYGYEEDRLEIMGLLTDEEAKIDGVAGHLTAEDVFERIKKHYEREEN